MKPFSAQAILFDLDGTLIDSVPDLHVAINHLLKTLGEPPVELAKIAHWVGNGSLTLVERALTFSHQAIDEKSLNAAHDVFLNAYQAIDNQYSVLFEGVKETLGAFHEKGIRMGLVTNKLERFVPALLKQFDLVSFFEVVVADDGAHEKKPSAAPLLYAARQLGVPVSNCLMVGDSLSDIAAAKACGMANVLMTYGYHQGLKPSDMGADALLDHFSELNRIVI